MDQRLKIITTLLLTCFFFYCCSTQEETGSEAYLLYEEGRFSEATLLINRLRANHSELRADDDLNILMERMYRIGLDFSKTEPEIRQELLVYFPELTAEQMKEWESSGKLEMRVIDNRKRYFRNAVPNLFRVDSQAGAVKNSKDGVHIDSLAISRLEITTDVLTHCMDEQHRNEPTAKFQIDFTITLKPGTVPAGEVVKCWMPFPRESLPRQKNVKLLSVSQEDYQLAGESALQRSIYLEQTAVSSKPVVFSYSAEFETFPQWADLTGIGNTPYNTSTELYRKYTAERQPHIIFSEPVKNLAAEITRDMISPAEKVRAIYYWINDNIPWASALEYSTFECIPHYVLENRKGDCGMQTLLFMSLARYCGIPCKWQSGWMLHPGEVNLHDWCEVYYEGTGWVPLDQSFRLQQTDDAALKEFYISGIDSYRLIVNDDFSSEFEPPKQFYRSEPIDFQRGELEWSGGNLYFDKWSYNMLVTYINTPEK
jgi:hypothetical protein